MILFAIPASAELADRAHALRTERARGPSEALRAPLRATAGRYVEDLVDGLVLSLLDTGNTTPFTAGLLRNISGIAKSVGHGLVSQVFGSASHAEHDAMAAYLQERLVPMERDRGASIGLTHPLDPALDAHIEALLAAARAGQAADHRPTLTLLMERVIDDVLVYHLDKPFALVELGFFTKKAVSVGRGAIHGGATTTVRKSIAADGEVQLAELILFLDGCRLRAG